MTARALLASVALLPLVLQDDVAEYRLTVHTTTGHVFTGTTSLGPLTVTNDMGDVKVDLRKVHTIRPLSDGKWWVITPDVALKGDLKLPDLVLTTSVGRMTVKQEHVRTISFSDPRPPPPGGTPAPPAPAPAPAPTPAPGKRESIDLRALAGIVDARVLRLTEDGRHFILLDQGACECVFVERATNKIARVPVELFPVDVVERAGRLYVPNANSRSIIVIDRATLRIVDRIALGFSIRFISFAGDSLAHVGAAGENVYALDLQTRVLTPLVRRTSVLAVSPDGSYAYAIDGCWLIRPGRATQLTGMPPPTLAPDSTVVDWPANRVYSGPHVYTLDLRRKVAELPVGGLRPHPAWPVLFGWRHSPKYGLATFDADTLAPLKEVDLERHPAQFVVADDAVHVLIDNQIVKIPIDELVPADYRAKRKSPRWTINPAAPPADADVARARALSVEADGLRLQGKPDEARKKFEESAKLDPLSGGPAGIAACLVAARKHDDAVAALAETLALPFREDRWVLLALTALADAHAGAGRRPEARAALDSAFLVDRRDPAVLERLAQARLEDGKPDAALALVARALEVEPKLDRLRKTLAELEAQVRKASGRECPGCSGKGKRTITVETEGKGTETLTAKCTLCDSRGRVWRRPCPRCAGTGHYEVGYDCPSCRGRGASLLPDRD